MFSVASTGSRRWHAPRDRLGASIAVRDWAMERMSVCEVLGLPGRTTGSDLSRLLALYAGLGALSATGGQVVCSALKMGGDAAVPQNAGIPKSPI